MVDYSGNYRLLYSTPLSQVAGFTDARQRNGMGLHFPDSDIRLFRLRSRLHLLDPFSSSDGGDTRPSLVSTAPDSKIR